MRVWLRRPFIWRGARYRVNSDGVEIPDDAPLPSDAQIWSTSKNTWVPAYKEGDSPRDRASKVAAKRAVNIRRMQDAVAGAALGTQTQDEIEQLNKLPERNPESGYDSPPQPEDSDEQEAKAAQTKAMTQGRTASTQAPARK